jgi:hypothetical protein
MSRRFFTRRQRRFGLHDVLWAFGIWCVMLCVSPAVAFYVLLVG